VQWECDDPIRPSSPALDFFAKFYIFSEVLRGGAAGRGLLWLVILAIGLSAVSVYYYLHVLKQIFVTPEPKSAPHTAGVPVTGAVELAAR
jgi:NADH-quinone oxidoreductase subunit N